MSDARQAAALLGTHAARRRADDTPANITTAAQIQAQAGATAAKKDEAVSITILIICALATYRLTRIVLIEDGPFDVALKLRGALDPDQKTWVGKGLACPWCVSFWIGPALAYLATYTAGLLFVSGMACSALVSLGMTYGSEIMKLGIAVLDRWRRGK